MFKKGFSAFKSQTDTALRYILLQSQTIPQIVNKDMVFNKQLRVQIQTAIKNIRIDICEINTGNSVTNGKIDVSKITQSKDIVKMNANGRDIPAVHFTESTLESDRRPITFLNQYNQV